MAKYYVECGEIKDVLNAKSSMEACVCSVIRKMKHNLQNDLDQNCNLERLFTVNEKGFVSERDSYKMDSSSEEFIDIKKVFQELNKNK
tara:strand:+ start:478 stop:741 length:264 start_codon:yes stop_codon:yes gene_type:complete